MRFEEMTVAPTSGDSRRLADAVAQLLDEHPQELRDGAHLLVTELLSVRPGAVSHEERLTIRIFADADMLRVEVHDGGRGAILRSIRQAADLSAGGWSPHLMNRMADRWGLVSDREGAWFWFEIALEEAGP